MKLLDQRDADTDKHFIERMKPLAYVSECAQVCSLVIERNLKLTINGAKVGTASFGCSERSFKCFDLCGRFAHSCFFFSHGFIS